MSTRPALITLALLSLASCATPPTATRPDVPALARHEREYRTLRGTRDELEAQGWHPIERAASADGIVRWVAWRYEYE